MVRVKMNRRTVKGASLIEVLTVIVVFLVGILAVVQVFPPGLQVLRTNRAQTQAISLARAKVQQVLGQSAQLPERIVAGTFNAAGTVFILSQTDPNSLTPPVDPVSNVGEVDANGQVIVAGNPVGHWSKLTGPNKITRIIGEGRPISQPTFVNGIRGSRMQLMFAPIFYLHDAGANRSAGQVLQVYGNDLRRATANLDDQIPDTAAALYDTDVFYFNAGEDATNPAEVPAAFLNQDQIVVGALQDTVAATLIPHAYRVSMSFIFNDGVNQRVVEAIFTAAPGNPYFATQGNYSVISIPELVAAGGFTVAGYRGVEIGSLRVQRIFSEVPSTGTFNQDDPYQFIPWNHAYGTLMLNPAGANYRVSDIDGNSTPLVARVDYSVYDWRIMQDDFSIPRPVAGTFSPNVKLLVNSIKPGSGQSADGTNFGGIGLATDVFMQVPTLAGPLAQQDFVLMGLQTGGFILGNDQAAGSPYFVDKSNGNVQFRDTDTSDGFAITGRIALPNGTFQGFTDSGPIELAGRSVRGMYIPSSELATQVLKASASYNVVYPNAPNQLVAGQCYEGASAGWGQPNRLYFPLIDRGQKVTIGELWLAGPSAPVVRDRDLKISGVEQFAGVSVAYAEIPGGNTFDSSRNGYAVRRVNGASIKVRSFYNPDTFTLGGSNTTNFDNLRRWIERYNTTTTETFDAGGNY